MIFEPSQKLLFIGDSVTDCDRAHPSAAGHMVLARAFLKKVGFDWNRS